MDEAGLGPNLGPLVIAMTVWDVEESPQEFDFWKAFESVLTNCPVKKDLRLHVADSKQVFQPHKSFGALERGVLSALRLVGETPDCFATLCRYLTADTLSFEISTDAYSYPWYCHEGCALPADEHDFSMADRWQHACESQNVKLVAIKTAIIEPRQFNRLIREQGNKSLVVSRIAFRLLNSIWTSDETPTFIVADKHGGRNRYDELLAEILDGDMIFRLVEGPERSDYRVGKTILRFQPRAEEHGPVALASMVAKYVRELAMSQFNTFWTSRVDGLKPTQGYPVDARRFYDQISETLSEHGLTDDDVWRCR